jgi:hypothetical protein
MKKKELSYESIQTPIDVWKKILELNPINPDNVFFEPFAGENTLYNLIPNENKDWCEIERGRNIFDYDFENSKVEIVYTNPPYVCEIPDKKGNMKTRNAVYYFLEMLMTKLTNLKQIGFIMNMSCFNSITPKRLEKLKALGFTISSITMFNCSYWYGLQLFVLFDKNSNTCFKHIDKVFTEKFKPEA